MAIFRAFGKKPGGKILDELKGSPQFRDGAFQNLSPTITLVKGQSFVKILWRFMNKPSNTKPTSKIPTVISDLKYPNEKNPVITWFGHSSYLIHLGSANILVDPVFSGYASPFSFGTPAFEGTDVYDVADLPEIDLLILTHDHYDHLDYKTVSLLKSSAKMICTSLGVASHLLYWGFDSKKIIELDWWQSKDFENGISMTAAPARHFSGRSFIRNKTLWSSFVLKKDGYTIYIGGDSGYDDHFKRIGERFGPMDIAILEAGQYDVNWPQIHMMPEETVQASIDLNAKLLLPVHWGKFSLSLHPWNEPIIRVRKKAQELGVKVASPMIGEPLIIGREIPEHEWWIFETRSSTT